MRVKNRSVGMYSFEEEENTEGERLPDTATDNYYLLLIGIIVLIGGSILYYLSRKKTNKDTRVE